MSCEIVRSRNSIDFFESREKTRGAGASPIHRQEIEGKRRSIENVLYVAVSLRYRHGEATYSNDFRSIADIGLHRAIRGGKEE
ncbi:hypothetical protein WN55_06841 [Dufourea novaeangliae]|nr:hypothetical protein WN55_06841 [Dufourea novaeangliae]